MKASAHQEFYDEVVSDISNLEAEIAKLRQVAAYHASKPGVVTVKRASATPPSNGHQDNNRSEVLRTLGRFASNPELSFTWYDAAVLSQKIRQSDYSQKLEVG